MKVVPTIYGRARFRSRTEARWAVFFDKLGIPWEYEPEGFLLEHGPYLPDFRLWGSLYAEVKPKPTAESSREFYEALVKRCEGMDELLLLVGAADVRWYRVICTKPPALRWIDLDRSARHGRPMIVESATQPPREDLVWPHTRFERACMDAAFHRFGRVA